MPWVFSSSRCRVWSVVAPADWFKAWTVSHQCTYYLATKADLQLTSLTITPPKLCATKIMGSWESSWSHMVFNRFLECWCIVLRLAAPMNFSTSASKPKLIMRTLRTIVGNKSRGQNTSFDAPFSSRGGRLFAAKVFHGPPNSPWTKQMLHAPVSQKLRVSPTSESSYQQASGLVIGVLTLPRARCPARARTLRSIQSQTRWNPFRQFTAPRRVKRV